jgi:hypothetical protein
LNWENRRPRRTRASAEGTVKLACSGGPFYASPRPLNVEHGQEKDRRRAGHGRSVREAFEVRDGVIVRRSNNQPAVFVGPKGRLLCRIYVGGAIRRVVAARTAWAIACGSWPSGIIKARDGNDRNFAADNLILVKRGHNPFSTSTASLKRRAEVDSALIATLAQHPGQTLPQLSQLIGLSESCCCTRLGRLEKQGLTCSPRCQAREHV